MRVVDVLRGQPTHVRMLATVSALAIIGTAASYVVLTLGLPKQAPPGPPARQSEATSTAQLIAERTQERATRDAGGAQSIPPAADGTVDEPADGILFLGARYREHDVTVILDRIEFYPSRTSASLTISNESEVSVSAAFDASVLEQQLEGSALLELPVLSTSGNQTLAPGSQTHADLTFAPTNGRVPFTLFVGTLSAGAAEWRARFSIDPGEFVKESST